MTIRDQCPACGGSNIRQHVRLPYDQPPLAEYLAAFYRDYPQCDFTPLAGELYGLDECGQCGCYFQNPVPEPDFLARFYGQGLYGSGAKTISSCDPYQTEQMLRELLMAVRFLSPTVARPCVLDFGTGNGNWAMLAAAAGLDTHASDLSPHAFEPLRVRGITCHPHDQLPKEQFDFINTEQVFEHLADPSRQLQVLAQGLRPGGVVKIGVPHDGQLRTKLRAPRWTAPKSSKDSLNCVAPLEHLNHFEPASLDALAARCGLQPLVINGWQLLPSNGPGQTIRKRLGLWLRTRLGEVYRPHFRLTQTAFYQKPVSLTSTVPCP